MAKQSALSVFISSQASAISELLATDPKVAAIFEENGVVLAVEEAEAPKASKGKGKAAPATKGKKAKDEDDDFEDDEDEKPTKGKGKGKAAPAAKGKMTATKIIAALEAGKDVDLDEVEDKLLQEIVVALELTTAKKAAKMEAEDLVAMINENFEEDEDDEDEDDDFEDDEDDEDEDEDDEDEDEDDDFEDDED